MFNGIIFNKGKVINIKRYTKSKLIIIESKIKFSNKDLGSSINCNGVCLTLTKVNGKLIYFYLSDETIKRSNFKYLKIGQIVNIEKSITFGQKISGHYVQGHVDTTAKVLKIKLIDKSWVLSLKITNSNLHKMLAEKASISINGVSLTISKLTKEKFELNIIPHTLNLTNLRNLRLGDFVNVELDIFGKYLYKYMK
tara:strand:- start:451 stop:1038 length:588 start_codon:yes stop_codon:yes gene_type:complete